MRKTTRLRKLIEDPKILVMPGAYDVISAKLAAQAGFDALQLSGANIVACHFGVPDYSLVSMREMVEQSARIANAVDIPAMGDADTGFGNAVNTYLTVQAFERAGVAGVNIEDQVMPKRCGHLEGKVLLPFDEAVAKVRAAAEARTDPDFVINARTDALGVSGIDEAVRRGNAYLEAGATMVFVEGANSVDHIRAAVKGIDGPVAVNLVEGGKSPQNMSFAELESLGVARVSLPSTAMQATIKALGTVFARVKADGAIGGYADLLAGFGVAQRLVGFAEILELEKKYLSALLPAKDRSSAMSARTIIDKIWDAHAIADLGHGVSLLQVDRIFMHDRTGGRMLKGIADAGHPVARPELVFGTFDHVIDTDPGRTDRTKIPGGTEFIRLYREQSAKAGIPLYDIGDPDQGIAHVVAPELGIALPGATMVCGDSHTCTLGGVGALAWGIGVSEGEHALATQALRVARPRTMRVRFDGALAPGVVAKDMVLALIGRYGTAGGRGHAIEFTGAAVRALPVEARLTLCNMAVEFGAWTGLVAPDDATLAYLAGRRHAPRGALWDQAAAHWKSLASDADASFDAELSIDCDSLAPQVTWGTSPQHVSPVDGRVPDPVEFADRALRASAEHALAYAGLAPGDRLDGLPIEAAFIGSCTNSRLSDLRAAARLLEGRHVASGVRAICVPGSSGVKRAAEAEGLDRVFRAAGFEWRESGCSLCFYAEGDDFGGARRVITSTNRNFENRQGPGVRSHLASPATVAVSAVAGRIADPRQFMR